MSPPRCTGFLQGPLFPVVFQARRQRWGKAPGPWCGLQTSPAHSHRTVSRNVGTLTFSAFIAQSQASKLLPTLQPPSRRPCLCPTPPRPFSFWLTGIILQDPAKQAHLQDTFPDLLGWLRARLPAFRFPPHAFPLSQHPPHLVNRRRKPLSLPLPPTPWGTYCVYLSGPLPVPSLGPGTKLVLTHDS